MRNRPVYPHLMAHCQVQNETETWPGMTLREHAAITLRVPDSGDEQLDAMIRQANRRDAAVAAMQGQLAAQGPEVGEWSESAFPELARISVALADALLAKLEDAK